MASKPPVSASENPAEDAAERGVEIDLQARREEMALGISRFIVRVAAALSITLLVVWLLNQPYVQVLIYAFLLLLLALGAGLYPVLQRRKGMTTGVLVVSGLCLIAVLVSPLLIDSLLPVVGITDVLAIVVAYLLLGNRRSRGLVAAFALAYSVDVVVVGILDWSPFPHLQRSTELWLTGAVSLVGFLTAILIIRLIVLGLEQQFNRAQRLNRELEGRMNEMNAIKEALRQERNLLRLLIDTVPANVYIKDTQSRFIDANLETALHLGVKAPSELIGKTDFDFFSPELAQKYQANEQAILQSGQPLRNFEEPSFDQRTQQVSWLLTTQVPIQDEHDWVTGLVGVSFDITERKQVQEQITQERDLLRTLIDHLPDYIFIKDANGHFVNSNTAHNRVAQVRRDDELRGKSAFDVFPPDLAAQFDADDQRVLQTGQALVNVERTSLDAEGHERTMLTTKVPLHDAAGSITGLVGISRDITDRKQAEQQALDLQYERQRVQILHQFIGDATHDLMTPIAGINLSADLARRAPDRERLIVHLGKIDTLSQKLQNRLQDMLTMSQLDMMTAQELELRAVDLAQLLRSLVETYRPRAQAKAQQLTGELDPQVGMIQADDLYLRMALATVVENAIHYTENGGTIQIALAQHEGEVALSIQDTGIGIVEADLAHIFERFYRAKNHRPLDAGSGLGLSIAQRIVELHRGRIMVASVLGGGTTFTLLLPSN